MDKNFETLKNKVVELIESKLSTNEKAVINYINTLLEKFGSKLKVRKNMSIKSFRNLLVNSSSVEDFKELISKLDINKDYEIEDIEGLNEAIVFNEEYYGKGTEDYKQYKAWLDSRIKLNDNLFMIEYK
jgi:hypothetical protein